MGLGNAKLGPDAEKAMFDSEATWQLYINDPLCKSDKIVLDTGATLLDMSVVRLLSPSPPRELGAASSDQMCSM